VLCKKGLIVVGTLPLPCLSREFTSSNTRYLNVVSSYWWLCVRTFYCCQVWGAKVSSHDFGNSRLSLTLHLHLNSPVAF